MRRAIAVALLAATPAGASTPQAWADMHRAAARACIAAAGLKGATASEPIDFSDASARTALVVKGVWPQRHMRGAAAQMLCLYDRRARRAEVVEARGWRAP